MRGFAKYVVWGYIFFIGSWFVLRLLFFDTFWWLALLNTAAWWLFLPLLLLIPGTLIARWWPGVLGLCLPLGLFGTLFGALLVPSLPPQRSPSSSDIRVMTFNVLGCNAHCAGVAEVISRWEMAAFLDAN